jgi:uncharacterized membrane protein
MKLLWIPALIVVLLYQCFLGCWVWSGSQLPERVATHFNGGGEPNGLMSRSANQMFMLAFGLAFPLVIVMLSYATRFLPRGLVNIPHRDYWLAPERRAETSNYLLHHSLWLACLAVCFVIGIQYSIVQANRLSPPHLSTPVLLSLVGSFLAGTRRPGWCSCPVSFDVPHDLLMCANLKKLWGGRWAGWGTFPPCRSAVMRSRPRKPTKPHGL